MFGHQGKFATNFSSQCASYPEKLPTNFVSFIMDHPVIMIELFAVQRISRPFDMLNQVMIGLIRSKSTPVRVNSRLCDTKYLADVILISV